MAARRPRARKGTNWIALDAGGTLTDAVIVDREGQFLVGKHLTNKQDESQSFLGAIRDGTDTAARDLDQPNGHP